MPANHHDSHQSTCDPLMAFRLLVYMVRAWEALRARAVTAFVKLVLWCLRNARSPDELFARLPDWPQVLRDIKAAPNGFAALATALRYIMLISQRPHEEALALLIEALPEDEESIMTAGEQLIERGRQEGLKEGIKEGLKEGQAKLLLKLLSTRFGALPAGVVAQVRGADSSTLDLWAERVLSAASLEEALAPA